MTPSLTSAEKQAYRAVSAEEHARFVERALASGGYFRKGRGQGMNWYVVEKKQIHTSTHVVEAESPEAAVEIAELWDETDVTFDRYCGGGRVQPAHTQEWERWQEVPAPAPKRKVHKLRPVDAIVSQCGTDLGWSIKNWSAEWADVTCRSCLRGKKATPKPEPRMHKASGYFYPLCGQPTGSMIFNWDEVTCQRCLRYQKEPS